MRRVYLFCNAGMSTSLLASKMQKVADGHNLPIEVKAFSDSKMESVIKEFNPDVIFLGPQVKYRLEPTVEKFGNLGIPIEVINLEDYGNVNGERVLKRAILLMKENKK